MMRRLTERPGLVFGLVFAWKVALLVFTAQPIPANDSFFYDGPVVNFLLHGKYVNPSLALVLPISGNEVFSAYPPLYQLALLAWMRVFGTSALSAMWLHLLLFGVYQLIVLAIFRRLRVPTMCVNLAGLFLLSLTFHDRPDSLAHVFGAAAIYACVRSCRSLGAAFQKPLTLALSPSDGERESLRAQPPHLTGTDGRTPERKTSLSPSDGERAGVRGWSNWPGAVESERTKQWAWVAATLTVLTLCTSLQIGAFYLLLTWLTMLAGVLFAKEKFPVAAMMASVLMPMGLVALVAVGFPHLWAGFLEHARLTPSATGLRLPQFTEILKVVRTVPGVLAVALLFPWLMLKRNESVPPGVARLWLVTGACVVTALAVVFASLFVMTANMVQIASYLQPVVVGGWLALVAARPPGISRPPRYAALFLGLAFMVSIRAIGMTTWGAACAMDLSYSGTMQRLHHELATAPRGSTVVVSAAYLYETARRDDVRWIHSDWPATPDVSGDEALRRLKPAKLIITPFDYYRRYEAVLAELQRESDLVEIKIQNTATLPPPDSIKSLQKVVQHISWAPVVVDFSWR